MGLWSLIKKDVGYFKKVANTEKRFHQSMWKLVSVNSQIKPLDAPRRPLSQLSETAKKIRIKKEYGVLVTMICLWILLTIWLVMSRNWEGFAVWLFFAALVLRSIVIIRKLKE